MNDDIYCSNTTQPITSWHIDDSSGKITFETPTYNMGEQLDHMYVESLSKVNNNKKGDDDMRYLYEVILVNPKNDEFYIAETVKRTETSALMAIYAESNFIQPPNVVPFDDLKTSCRVLMEWKKEKSLKKAIETIKEAVE